MGGSITQSGFLRGSVKATGNLTGTIRPQGVLKGTISKPLIVGDNETVYIIRDDAGNELVGVLTDVKPVLDATANDIRKGVTAVTEEGITEGTKVIPRYYVSNGYKLISPGNKIAFQILKSGVGIADYTKLQAIVCQYTGTTKESTAAEMIAIDDGVYLVKSNTKEATITKNTETHTIDFGVINSSENRCVVRYVICKEVL